MEPAGRDHGRMTATTSRTDWLLFILLGFLWGSSFLFIKIGVEAGLPPFTLVMLRLLIGFGLLAVVVAAARERLPRGGRIYGHLFVMGAINIAVPFTLITWAEMHVDSTLTSVLNAAVPIFVIPIGAIFLRDEPLTVGRVVGVLLGFVGVALLVGFDPAAAAGVDLLGALAVIAATISYAAGAVYARRNVRGLRPMIPALFQVGFGLLITSVLAFVLERPFELTLEPQALLAVVWLGLLGSGVAYLVFFGLLGRRGAAGTAVVAYLLPVFGVTLGVLVLHEPLDGRLLAGLGLIIGGIALVNSKIGLGRFRPERLPSPTTGVATDAN
jgi:drug/metabolite transporter (DMT)-like permease